MGSGIWSSSAFDSYTRMTKGAPTAVFTSLHYNAQDLYKARSIDPALNPMKVMRECLDSKEHPNTLPVILALDVTGSMGSAATEVAQKLNDIMTDIYTHNNGTDVEFCIMALGDTCYDNAPIQISQFESDIRIAEQLDKVYFEAGGGGNNSESYSAAWYMGAMHTKCDCWNRGQKGIIITLGDELPDPHLVNLDTIIGDQMHSMEQRDILKMAQERYNIYHIAVDDKHTSWRHYLSRYDADKVWKELLGNNFRVSTINGLSAEITSIIEENTNAPAIMNVGVTEINSNGEIVW